MQRDLEDTAWLYHVVLRLLHATAFVACAGLVTMHLFASVWFGRRAVRDYNEFRPQRGIRFLLGFLAFHLIAGIVSLIASKAHARDAREPERRQLASEVVRKVSP